MKRTEVTPIKDVKPQLIWIGKILGMDLYIDVCGQTEQKYGLAQAMLNIAVHNLDKREDNND